MPITPSEAHAHHVHLTIAEQTAQLEGFADVIDEALVRLGPDLPITVDLPKSWTPMQVSELIPVVVALYGRLGWTVTPGSHHGIAGAPYANLTFKAHAPGFGPPRDVHGLPR